MYYMNLNEKCIKFITVIQFWVSILTASCSVSSNTQIQIVPFEFETRDI